MILKPLFVPEHGRKVRVALFLSGTGSNARVILQDSCSNAERSYEIVLLVTDAPEKSSARALAKEYDLPLVELDIKKYYLEHGEEKIALNTPRRCELRDQWSELLYEKILPFNIEVGVLAGFVPLSNIVGKLPCLNVHPGDLTVTENGERILAGLHYRPVETAILKGHAALRSSVILAQHYNGNGKGDVDSGPVLGVSGPVAVDLDGATLDGLNSIQAQRSSAPYKDKLRQVAEKNIEQLKINGDHVVLPQVLEHFTHGDYALDEKGNLHFLSKGKWEVVETVEFFADRKQKPRFPGTLTAPNRKKKSGYFKRLMRYYYTKIVRTPGTPEFVARGWALGVAVGCIIPVFCQLLVAIPLSFVFRCSKIGAISGTFITTPPTAIFIYPVQIWIGAKLIGSDLASGAAGRLVEVFNGDASFTEKWRLFAAMGGELVAAFFAGGVAWALIMVPLTYFGIRKIVVSYRAMRLQKREKKAHEA